MKKYIKNLDNVVESTLRESLVTDAAELVGIEEDDAEERIKGLSFANYIELGNAIELEDAETVREILSTVAPIEETSGAGGVGAGAVGAGGGDCGGVTAANGYGGIGTWDGKKRKKEKPGLKKAGSGIYEDGSDTLYHVTHTKYIPQIQKSGLRPMGAPSNWVQQGSGDRYGMGEIYVFTSREDAKKWAGRMDWEYNQTIGSGEISIITLNRPEGHDFEKDEADPMSQAGQQGEWLKTYEPIAPENIVGAQVFKSMNESINEGSGNFGLLTPEEMQGLPTPRLLAYYKAKRKESKQNQASMYYDGDGEYSAELDKVLQIAKNILDTREHLGEDIFDEEKLLDKPTPTLKDLAKKHDMPLADMGVQLAKGIKAEKEHTTDMLVAKEIALDHLNELPDYYDRLEKMEEADNPYAATPAQPTPQATPPSTAASSIDALAQPTDTAQQNDTEDNQRKDVDDLSVGDPIEVIDIGGDPTAVKVKNPRGPGETLIVQTDKGEEHIVKKMAVSGTPTIQEMYESKLKKEERLPKLCKRCKKSTSIWQGHGEAYACYSCGNYDDGESIYESALTDRIVEVAPPGMEDWIKKRKPEFKKRYGDDWESVLYATAWKQKNNESIEEELDDSYRDEWDKEDARVADLNDQVWGDLGFKRHKNWPGGTTQIAHGDLRKAVRAKYKQEGWEKEYPTDKRDQWYVHPTLPLKSAMQYEPGITFITSMGTSKLFGVEEARNASNTEHSGAKKGRGGYYGRKKDAKSDSNKKRRANDKKAVDENFDPATHVNVEHRDPEGRFIIVHAAPAGYWAVGQGRYSQDIDRTGFDNFDDALEHAELCLSSIDESLDVNEIRRLAGLKETASAGATGAGAVATAPTAMGGVVKRSPSIYDKPKPKKRTKESNDDGIGRSKKK